MNWWGYRAENNLFLTGNPMNENFHKIFEPFVLTNGITLRNRIVMAPMTTWAGNTDGSISDEEITYYRRRVNGVGLVITGCTHVQENGIGFTNEFASYDDRFIPSLKRLADAGKSGGAPIILQLFHAGNKAISELIPNGDVVSASAVKTEAGPFGVPALTPRQLTHDEIKETIRAFGDATRRAIEAGFDGVELHGAHSFLIQNFFSPKFNRRTDEWGGSLENRLRFPLAVVQEVKRVIKTYATRPFLLGYRLSPEEPGREGLRIDDTYVLIDELINHGIGYLHVSLTNILETLPIDNAENKTVAMLLLERINGRVPAIAAGQIKTPNQAAEALELGLPLVAIGKTLVVNPDWIELAEKGHSEEIDIALDQSKIVYSDIPSKLWEVIDATPGWFNLKKSKKNV